MNGSGVDCIEVSDNCIAITDAQRESLVRMALDAGLEVHGEAGYEGRRLRDGETDAEDIGPDANLGNVAWDQVINVECLRQGIIGIAGPGYL